MHYSYLVDTVGIKTVEEKGNKGVFHIEGLYTGYGITLGNALRRVLLSSLPGAAISQVRINGVKHEFSTIPGMQEDVIAFTLNLKQVRFHFHADEPQTLSLRVKGVSNVTAGDIASTSLAEVINKDLHIATLTNKKAELDMEIVVEKGLGYVPAESRRMERVPVGAIMLDSIFSPVRNVQFKIEDMRVGERTDFNRLRIEVETDGSITPSRAIHRAANILRDHFDRVAGIIPSEKEGDLLKTKKPVKKTTKKATKNTATATKKTKKSVTKKK